MTDPSWTDATRNAIHKRLGLALGFENSLTILAGWMHPQNSKWLVRMRHGDEGDAVLSNWNITAGVIGVDTDASGLVYGVIDDNTPGAGEVTINLYNDSGRSQLVATGNANDSNTVTLTAQSGYNLAGTVFVGAPSADEDFSFYLIPPAVQLLEAQFDLTEEEDSQTRDELLGDLALVRTQLVNARSAARAMATRVLRTLVRRKLVAVSDQNALLVTGLNRQSTGAIQVEPYGLLEDLRRAQANNTGGSGEIKAGGPTNSGSASFTSAIWEGQATTPTLNAQAVPGVVTFLCEKGLGSDGKPRFRATFKPTDTRRAPNLGRSSIAAEQPLTIGQTWKSPLLGIDSFQVDYKASINNSTNTPLSTTASLWSVTGLNTTNSDNGKLYVIYVSPDDTLRFYRSSAGRSNLDADELVAQITSPGTASAFTTEENDSGLTVSGTTGASLANNDAGEVDFLPPSPTQPADQFTLTISETVEAGRWVKALRDGGAGGQPWRPNVGSSPNLVDGWIEAGMAVLAGLGGDAD